MNGPANTFNDDLEGFVENALWIALAFFVIRLVARAVVFALRVSVFAVRGLWWFVSHGAVAIAGLVSARSAVS